MPWWSQDSDLARCDVHDRAKKTLLCNVIFYIIYQKILITVDQAPNRVLDRFSVDNCKMLKKRSTCDGEFERCGRKLYNEEYVREREKKKDYRMLRIVCNLHYIYSIP